MWIDFEKWHGCLNDFIVTWADDAMIIESLKRQAVRLCKRDGSAIGADGILILKTKNARDLNPSELIVINQDGSLAKNCGNGLRCAALSIYKRHIEAGEMLEGVSLDLAGRHMDCRFLTKGHKKATREQPFVAVTMGEPVLDAKHQAFKEIKKFAHDVFQRLLPSIRPQEIHYCELGNPHLVFLLDEQLPIKDATMVGEALQTSPYWDGVNAHFVCEEAFKTSSGEKTFLETNPDSIYKTIPFERGVGLTQACGSGASAIGAAILGNGFVERNDWLVVKMPGGSLYVKQDAEDDPVILAGPAELSFVGKLEI